MALIQCPKCGKQFSEHARACPQCGTSIEEAFAIIKQRQEEERLAVEREAAERERQRQEEIARQERIRKAREAREAQEARIRAEKRAEWWAANKKKVRVSLLLLIGIIVALIAASTISNLIAEKKAIAEAQTYIASGDSCIAIYHFVEAGEFYERAYRATEDNDIRETVQEKQSDLQKARQAAYNEYEKNLKRLKILLAADDNEFNELSNACLDKMIEIYPDKTETKYYIKLRGK